MAAYAVLAVDEMRIGLAVTCIECVVHAVELTALPRSPEIVLGIVDVRGQVVPVLDLRRRLRLPERPIGLRDRLVIARSRHRSLALVADAVEDLVSCDAANFVGAQQIVPGLEFVQGIVAHPDGLVLVHDLDRFLSLEEVRGLERALESKVES